MSLGTYSFSDDIDSKIGSQTWSAIQSPLAAFVVHAIYPCLETPMGAEA